MLGIAQHCVLIMLYCALGSEYLDSFRVVSTYLQAPRNKYLITVDASRFQTRQKSIFSPWGALLGPPLHAPATFDFGRDLLAAIFAQDDPHGSGPPPVTQPPSPSTRALLEMPPTAQAQPAVHPDPLPAITASAPCLSGSLSSADPQPSHALAAETRSKPRQRGAKASTSAAASRNALAPYPQPPLHSSGTQDDGATKEQFHQRGRNKARRQRKRVAQPAASVDSGASAVPPDLNARTPLTRRPLKSSAAKHRQGAQASRTEAAQNISAPAVGLDYVPVVGQGFTGPVLSLTEDDRTPWTAQELVDLLGFDYEEWDGK